MSYRSINHRLTLLLGMVLVPALLLGAIFLISQDGADASSHREAPLISKDQFADTTDVYAFVSPTDSNNVVLIANWIPFEGPEGGPNYYEWDPNVLYDIHIDNDGDAKADVTYTLNSSVMNAPVDTFLYNVGPITSLTDTDLIRRQRISVTETFEPGVQPNGGTTRILLNNEPGLPVNIGSKSMPDFSALEQEAIREVTADNGDKIKIFAGPADDPFWVDLQVFDLLTLRGEDGKIGYQTGNNIPVDSLSGFNVHSLVLEIPKSRLVRNNEPVLGVWATSRRATINVANPTGPKEFVQVSRLGMPLTNEAVLPIQLKDAFNSIKPEVDLTLYGTLQPFVENPTLGQLLCGLYDVPLPGAGTGANMCNTEFTPGVPRSGRGDIFDIFLTGMKLANDFTIVTKSGNQTVAAGTSVNQPGTVVPADMLRLNTNFFGDICSPTPSRLGVLGGDVCGFPNGRRLADDAVEIELLAVAGAAYNVLDARKSFTFNSGLIDVLTDNVDTNDLPFRSSFPYVAQAQSGQSHFHENATAGLYLPSIRKMARATGMVVGENGAASTGIAFIALILTPAAIWYRRRQG